eukprot:776142-Rhodomonas_salina.6
MIGVGVQVEFARQNSIPVVAANAPRRYVSRVGSAGRGILSLLPPQALQFLPPLPYAAASKVSALPRWLLCGVMPLCRTPHVCSSVRAWHSLRRLHAPVHFLCNVRYYVGYAPTHSP